MVYITFIADDFKRVMSAIAKVKVAVRTRARNIGYQMGIDYLALVHLNIVNQKYSGSYQNYNPVYRDWKAKQGADLRFWILKGDLLAALTVWRTRRGWTAGIPAGILDSGGKNYTGEGEPSYIAAYARIMEWGGSFQGQDHPARSVFTPTLEEYRRAGARKRINESKKIIVRSWR